MTKVRVLTILAAIVAVSIAVLWWDKMHRETAQPASITGTARDQYLYGSVGAEGSAGIPYWIWLVLPRIFPEYLPATGGYLALGLSWEETREMPVGLSKKRTGYVRVAGNCALCHAYSRSNGYDYAPTLVPAAMGHTDAFQKMLKFYRDCANDPRFNADNILDEVYSATKLSTIDRLIYRYVLIPRTRARFLSREPAIIDAELLEHSQNPRSRDYRSRLQALANGLDGAERSALEGYLAQLH
jgi:hypothetical protein